ncbi:zinc-binding alcohol dehydrogenase family protein [Catenovulum sp. SX2]|uniref:zinc-binding alcohol dehydrogenase family protein n=1 Tax=Catenovulum sp. SX2 TaxID=3398614 RepID=UPI003F87DD80
MKAIGYTESLEIGNPQSLQDIELAIPQSQGHDLLVKINAIAVNPVDYKIRQCVQPENNQAKVLGWDAVGEVVAVGDKVSLFNVGDQVFYAGDLTRQGANAQYQLVDERIVGRKPSSLTNAEAAAIPLTAITAWEMLFDHLQIQQQSAGNTQKTDEVILVTGAAGGVGSILIQIVKAITGATVIATASRESSKQWVTELGADYVVDHSKPLAPQIESLNIGFVTHVASLNGTDNYLDDYIQVLKPFGKLALIDESQNFDINKLKYKAISTHWELMFTRSMFKTDDMIEQHKLLNQVAKLIDQGHIKTTLGKHLGTINAENLRQAHAELEARSVIGKIVLEGF